jgi:hypothetical protein
MAQLSKFKEILYKAKSSSKKLCLYIAYQSQKKGMLLLAYLRHKRRMLYYFTYPRKDGYYKETMYSVRSLLIPTVRDKVHSMLISVKGKSD